MHTLTIVTIEFAAAAHLMMSLVLFYFSRRRVMYLSQAWIMLLFCLIYAVALFYVFTQEIPPLGILHPVLLVYLLACSFLQSIYPLGLCMPGYLQWGRMWGYALPALGVVSLYLGGMLLGSEPVKIYRAEDFQQWLLSGDVLLRIGALALSGYYIINIFRLPARLIREFDMPRYLKVYGMLLGLLSLYFVIIALSFQLLVLIVYILLFTLINLFLFFSILEPVLNRLQQPPINYVEECPSPEVITLTEQKDFNEANRRRFERLEYLMQHERPWRDNQFNRDKLCKETGVNRHLLLQCLRSQGYNDTHEYINRYRIEALKKAVLSGEITEVKDCEKVGFGSLKTARCCFARMEDQTLESFFEAALRQRPDAKDVQEKA